MTIEQRENELRETFGFFDDWMDKYEHIIQLGKELPLLAEEEKADELLIKGCQSRVWLKPNYNGEVVTFKADSDAIITKGIISILIKVLNNQKPKDIVDAKLEIIDEIGLKEHLSPTRSNGLVSMIKQIKNYALAYSLTQKAQ
ncbi:SufE family protein [Luteibaculum oceani]|uniref:SufE family protein n=1 Tax=Luteibaculum oceani TaxID=1294296 RepID=A0A5C6VKX3_9FLAO|nr:SufE family protein [Luteibaculum oceani]TXC85441.1 SufE family protein [Luteibaculum oceani]